MKTPRELVGALLAGEQNRNWRKQHLWGIYIVGMAALGISYMFGALVLALVAAARPASVAAATAKTSSSKAST